MSKPNPVATIAMDSLQDGGADKLGTTMDQQNMDRLGKTQELRRNFKFLSVLGFTAVLMCTWEAILFTASYILPNGGLAGMVWMYVVCVVGFGFSILSMAEMASMAPTSGAWCVQNVSANTINRVSEFSPRSWQRFLSYISGWLCVLGWQVNIASGCYLVALQLQGIIALNDASYVAKPWHGTLMVIANATVCVVFNTFFAKKLPLVEGLMLVIHVFGFFAILIPLWVLSPIQPANEVFGQFTDVYGWPSQGLACLVGIVGPMYSLLGPDSAVHMSEEIRDASRVLPLAMMWTLIINGTTGFIMVVTFAFCIPDQLISGVPNYGFTYIDVFYNSTGSTAAASVMTALITLLCFCSTISAAATSSRQMFAFARDRGLPFSSFLCRVRPGWEIPFNAVCVSFVITCLLSLINLGSAVAFNAIVSLTVGAILSSYIISISCVALRKIRKDRPLPHARWSLGKAGLPMNIIAVLFLLVVYVFTFFPIVNHPTLSYMNWSSPMYAGTVTFAVVYFFVYGRKVYSGPVVLVKEEH